MNYADIMVGTIYEFERSINENDIMTFAELSGDFNPLHVDKEFGRKSRFKNNVVHGMLAGSLFSTLIGIVLPRGKQFILEPVPQFQRANFP